jgi:hypothetical protein
VPALWHQSSSGSSNVHLCSLLLHRRQFVLVLGQWALGLVSANPMTYVALQSKAEADASRDG